MKDNLEEIAEKYKDELFGMGNICPVHCLGVARACYIIAREQYGMDIADARKAFMLGWLHDIGYEFEPTSEEHAGVGADIAESVGFEYSEEIRHHGTHGILSGPFSSDMLDILCMGDLLADGKGRFVTAEGRLEDLASRHPEEDGVVAGTEKIIEYLIERGLLDRKTSGD